MDRSDRDLPEETTIELGPGEEPSGTPRSLDPDRDQAERNAASGGWDGANEQIENDFEAEQLRADQLRGQGRRDARVGEPDAGAADEDAPPLT